MSQALAIISSIAAVITALTVIFTALKNGRKKIRAYEDQKETLDKIAEKMTFLDELPKKMECLEIKIDDIKNDFDVHMKDNKRQTELLIEVARDLLINEMTAAIKRGWDAMENKTRIAELFGKYDASKGNHGVKLIYEQYEILPIEPIKDE